MSFRVLSCGRCVVFVSRDRPSAAASARGGASVAGQRFGAAPIVVAAALAGALLGLVGCGGPADAPSSSGETSATRPLAGPSAEGAKYLLADEPANAVGVRQAKAEAASDAAVTVVGRVGGDVDPWLADEAGFLIVDLALKPCDEKDDDACPTPWDYCCDTDVLPAHKALVKIVDAQGRVVPTGARGLLGIRETQTVVARGKAQRDAAGNLTVLADALYAGK